MGKKTRGKKRVALLLPAELVDRIDRDAHDAGITRTKYINGVLMGDRVGLDVKDKADALRHLLDNPENWNRLPSEFKTLDVFRALANLDQAASAAILVASAASEIFSAISSAAAAPGVLLRIPLAGARTSCPGWS